MARLLELKNAYIVVGSNISFKIHKSAVKKILQHRITGTTTIETENAKIVFSPESEPMIFITQ